MAVVAPPPTRPGNSKKKPGAGKTAAKTPPAPARDERHWMERFARSGYFLAAVLIHLLIFILVASWVVFKPPTPPPDDFVKTYVPQSAPPPPPPPPPQTVTVKTVLTPTVSAIVSNSPVPSFTVPLPTPTVNVSQDTMVKKLSAMPVRTLNNLASRLPFIKDMETKNWSRDASNIAEANGDPKAVVAKFPVYLASYANGDWDCNIHMDNGKITAGSLPDLVAKINEWSHNKLKGTVEPTPLAIGSADLLAKKPPFIFFTGHKDFVLTDAEIANLREYLQDGGAIWGDNALAGRGSRFDIAFRREMKRVIPDIDKQFEPLPLSHDLFDKKGWFPFTSVPEGMNYYAEPIEHLDIDGKIAIIYTPNDYSDLFFMRILPGDKDSIGGDPEKGSPLFSRLDLIMHSEVFYRNYNLPSCLTAQKFGMNIVAYLLVRFDEDLLLSP